MNWIKDKVLLVISASALLTLLLSGAFVLAHYGLHGEWTTLWFYTALLFVAVISTALVEMKRRARHIYRIWPLIIALFILLIAHVAVLGWLISVSGREWRMFEYVIAGFIEVSIFVVVLERAYKWSVARNILR